MIGSQWEGIFSIFNLPFFYLGNSSHWNSYCSPCNPQASCSGFFYCFVSCFCGCSCLVCFNCCPCGCVLGISSFYALALDPFPASMFPLFFLRFWLMGIGKVSLVLLDKDPLHLEISPFVHFMVQILFHKSNDI